MGSLRGTRFAPLLMVAACAAFAIAGLTSCNGRSAGSNAAPQPPEDVELTGGMHVGDFDSPNVLQSSTKLPWRVFKPKPADARYQGIAPNPSGKYIWLSDTVHDTLVQMAMDGTQRVFSLKTGHGQLHPGYFAFGRDGDVYIGGCLNGSACNVIGILQPQGGTFRVVSVPSGDGPGQGHAFVLGPDGNVWFTEQTHVGMITPAGMITEYAAPQFPSANIVVGSDHNLWFDGEGTTKCYVRGPSSECPFVVRLDPSTGKMQQFFLTQYSPPYTQPYAYLAGGMTTGLDGNVYVLVQANGYYYEDTVYLDAVVPNGDQTATDVKWWAFGPNQTSLVTGHGGALWWSAAGEGSLANYYKGVEHRIFAPNYVQTLSLAAGGDGNIWAIGNDGSVIVYVTVELKVTPSSLEFLHAGHKAVLEVTFSGKTQLGAESENPNIATVEQIGPYKFAVSSVRKGTTTVTVHDSQYNSFDVPVRVD